MANFVHPAKEDITLSGVLSALSDPMRLRIVASLLEEDGCMNCSQAAPCTLPKSTLSHHFRILREAGIVRTTKKGVENRNTIRKTDLNDRFPGLLKTIMKLAEQECYED